MISIIQRQISPGYGIIKKRLGDDLMKIHKNQLQVKTHKPEDFYEITDEVRKIVKESGIKEGILTVFSPHTTGALCINENADSDVIEDMIYALDKAFPDDPKFKHMEGNSHAHLKSINLGNTLSLIVSNSLIDIGIWQGIFFCEFDGPRDRTVTVHIMGE